VNQVNTQLKILVFDDDERLPVILKKIFEQQGHAVEVYSDPTHCPLYKAHKDTCDKTSPCVDVLISDINMPNVSGVELITRQKKCECKIIDENRALMSSDDCLHEDLGCNFFRKPFNISDVLQWLEECAKRTIQHRHMV